MFSDAVDREAAYLRTTGDGLPDLTAIFQIIQPRWPRTPATRKTQLYVLRAPSASYRVDRFSSQRTLMQTQFVLHALWPLSSGTGSGESDQLALEQAIDQVITRVEGPLGNKTHGSRFLQIGEQGGITVEYGDPSRADGIYIAQIRYMGEDPEITN